MPERISTNIGMSWPRSPKRLRQFDPTMAMPALYDRRIARALWESLPLECRSDHFNKSNLPQQYLSAVPEVPVGNNWTSRYLNFRGLPEPMTWEIAWLIGRYVELGKFVQIEKFNAAFRLLKAAVTGGDKPARTAESLLHLSQEEWVRSARMANMKGVEVAETSFVNGEYTLGFMIAVLGYAYHRGQWWELNIWNPLLDSRIPQRDHEPRRSNVLNFLRLTSDWLREGAKFWLSAGLSTERYSWSTVKSRLDALKWLQRYIDVTGDNGPCLVNDPHELRGFIRGFCDMLISHRVQAGPRTGQPLGKNPRRQVMTSIEQFYQFMYDRREDIASEIGLPEWSKLRPEHNVLFRPEDKPRMTNVKSSGMVLEDSVMQQIAEGSGLLALPRSEGGFGDVQAFHVLMLLLRTGRRANEILMMDFDPLEPITRARGSSVLGESDSVGFVARMRYQQTKVDSSIPSTIPVDEEIVTIIRAQQEHAKAMMKTFGSSKVKPRYLFLRSLSNRFGDLPYPMATMNTQFRKLTQELKIVDSVGNQVEIAKTHRFRHTAATNLINAGVPLHVVMRYFGHMSPEMTLHYAAISTQTMEEQFLKYKKVDRDGRSAMPDDSDLLELLQLERRADRVLPNGWCLLPPKQECDKGNACLSCSKFVTDKSHEPQLVSQLHDTEQLIERRQSLFLAKYGVPMEGTNVWLKGRQSEVDSLNRILLSIRAVPTKEAIRGPGVSS